ncbi:TPA: helix-turn-helix transcriptional regulator [Legionella pneumophila]|nr:helix-turn-helix transcriptional regulator [Legionella pneumophila]
MGSPVPKRLKEARLAMGMSQKKLGIAAGMDEFSASARMNHYEVGRHTPDYSMLCRIADILGLPVAYFYAASDDLAECIRGYDNLTPADKKLVLSLIKAPAELNERRKKP